MDNTLLGKDLLDKLDLSASLISLHRIYFITLHQLLDLILHLSIFLNRLILTEYSISSSIRF